MGIPLVEGKARVPRATRTASTNNDPVTAATVAHAHQNDRRRLMGRGEIDADGTQKTAYEARSGPWD